MNSSSSAERIIASVESVNEKGVKIEGEWHNYSRFAKDGDIATVSKGQIAEAVIDKSGFIRQLAAVDAPAQPSAPPEPAEPWDDALPTVERLAVSKDLLIAREVAIKCASEFVSLRTDLRSCDMLQLAEKIEQWILR